MGTIRKSLLLLAGFCLPGCIYVTQPAPPQVYTTPTPDYAPAPVVSTPPPQETVVYQPPPPEVAPVYQDELAPYGEWIVYGTYGRCWRPRGVVYGWQPYTVGHWVYADDGNCYWVSEANEVAWGPTVYHYGQWAYTSDFGWIWVPGTTYAPAWVAWRDGGGYCGWAPLPPEACYGGTVTYVVADRYCPPERYVYVQEGDVNVTRVDQRVIRNNTTIINRTTNITNITIVNNRVVNNGVPANTIERNTGRQIERVKVADASSPEQARRLAATGVPVHYSTPAIEQVHERTAAKVNRVQHDQPADRQRQLELNNAAQTDRDEQIKKDQAVHQQELDAQKQAHDQQVEAQRQAAADKAAEHQRQVEADRQAAADKAAEHERQVEADRQAAVQKQAEHQQQIEAQRQADADRQAQRDRQGQQNPRGQQGQPGQPDNGDKQGKPKVKPGENPGGGPPQ